ncbi:DUF167 domain-containing protein [Ostreiculturibacter nitratireducens]|uniref:DUF167 domain-containing protein n=1 Tax=Ostreiculturibacter nitratireducens TaxID=3075226 RepID=UPI0031B59155
MSGKARNSTGAIPEIAPGEEIAVRVTPRASRNAVVAEEGLVRVYVTVPPEGGKANAAVQELLAEALGVAKTRLELVRGASSREKTFRLLP